MFNATVIAILWKLLLNPNGIVNYVLGSFGLISDKISWLSDRKIVLGVLTFINIWAGYPFYMISILAGLQGVPGELYEASSIDGASASQTFFFITIPQLKPILISITMLDFIWTTQNFSLIWLLTAGGPSHGMDIGRAAAQLSGSAAVIAPYPFRAVVQRELSQHVRTL